MIKTRITLKSESVSCSVLSDCLRPHGPAILFCPWNSPDKNTGVGSYSLLQGIFPTQGSNPGHLHCKQILYHLCAIWVSNSASVYLSRAKKNVIGNNIHTPMFMAALFTIAKIWEHPKWSSMEQRDVVHVYNGNLLSHKKEWNAGICDNMHGPWGYYP